MRKRFGITIAWLAAAFVLFGAAFGFAQTGSEHANGPHPKATPTVEANDDQGDEVSDEQEAPETDAPADHERKQNHGFFVSGAAHCENVDDPATAESPDFTAPADCADNGKAHGEYVRSVAKSDVGKPDKGHNNEE